MAIDLSRVKGKIESFEKKTREKKDYSKVLFKPEKGKTYTIRIVESKYDPTFPFTEIFFHYELGVPYTVVALEESVDPIIIAANKLRKSSNPTERELAYKLTPKAKYYMPIIVRGEEDKGVRLYAFNKELYTTILNYVGDVEENGDVIDVKNGSDFTLTTTEEKMGKGNLTYLKPNLIIKRKPSPLSTDINQITEWLENQPDPSELYEKKTPEELKALLFAKLEADTAEAEGGDADTEDEEDEDPLNQIFPPAPTAPAKKEVATPPAATSKASSKKDASKFTALFE